MDKYGLLNLIGKMNTPDEQFTDSSRSVSWKAHREAEALADPALLPLLQEIVEEHEGREKAKRRIRDSAYFIIGRIMQKSFRQDTCAFFLQRLGKETDKYVLSSMLDRIHDWWRLAGLSVPGDLDISPILALAKDGRSLVRHSAIHALGACPGRESRDVLAYYLSQEDEKAYKYEIYYANIAMQGIGEAEDIPLLERHLKSRRQDIKITADYAARYIRERNSIQE